MGDDPVRSEKPTLEAQLDIRHLRREARTALELAVVTLAPWNLIERLGMAAGLLEALAELPTDSPPSLALAPKVLNRAIETLEEWRKWHGEHLRARLARG
jgi:hypothetical protein